MQDSQFLGLIPLALLGLVVWYAFRRSSGVKRSGEPLLPSDQGGQPSDSD